MVDTPRTISDLTTNLYPDGQAAGSISANDHRDLIVSLEADYGCMYVSTAAATTVGSSLTWFKAAGTTTLALGSGQIDMPTNNRLRYTGTPTRLFTIQAGISMTTAASNVIVGLSFGKNGTADTITQVRRKVGTGSDIGAAAVVGMFQLATNDYVELFVLNETSGTNITIEYANMTMTGHAD